MKRKANALFKSLISLILCFSMLVGTTFAWFTDSVKSGINTIAAGNLDVELYHTNAAVTDERVNSETKLFMDLQGNPILWEPGVVSYENLRVANEGDLALAYQLAINTANENFILDPANNAQYGLSQILKVGVVEGGITATDRAGVVAAVKETDWTTLATFLRSGSLLPVDGQNQQTWGVVIYWQPGEDDNRWNLNNGKVLSEGETLQIDLGVKLVATQEVYESDAFGDNYDTEAKAFAFPNFVGGSASAAVVPNDQGQTTAAVTMDAGVVSATVPAGAQLAAGVTKLTLNVSMLGASGSNITLGEDEAMRSLDVHVDGLAENNTVPVTVTLKEAAPKGLNMGNYKVYHVEKDGTKEMTLVDASADFTAHNQFKYDPATGDVTLYMATFSEVAFKASETNAWKGNFDYSWYTNAVAPVDGEAVAEYIIANADQLAAFGAIVGGMNGQTQNSFAGKTVKLISDINLGDKDDASTNLFYPIGYYNDAKSYTKPSDGTATAANVTSFQGTFDGNGHTIANFYQNTWQMWGNYDGNYYKAAMGLFGYVVNGTVKNLTVDSFSSDGEFTPTGVIAAYAVNSTFENIAITNCNPRVYNTGNGGIIGIAGRENEAVEAIVLKNITVDNSNKISALWGSWDVACGGLVGMYRGNVDGNGNATGDTISFDNCHVSAQIDVYNDVCANYQYYAYRYAGMIIGSIRHNTTNAEGKTIPNMTGISATGCTVHFGTWNDYYYCEIIDNTTASYTHDYQMSRLTEIKAIDGTTVTYLDGTTGTVPASGRANYVIVDYTKGHGTENATCYHFKDGAVWTHDMGGIQPGIDENGDGQDDLREDKQHLYLEFNNLFTGYGWGVSSMAINKWNGITALDVTTGDQEASVEKFEGKVTELANNKKYKLSDIFTFVDKGVELVPGALTVTVTNLDENNPVSATIVYDRENWENGTLTLTGAGKVNITIQDYYFCTPTTIEVNITDRQAEKKFETKFTGDFLYRVGNMDNVSLGTMFEAVEGAEIGVVSVTVEAVDGTAASGNYTSNATWTNGTIDFNGTGIVKVTIEDDSYCTPTVLYLEVINAKNVTTTTAFSATANNVVLLNDCGFSSLDVKGGYTLYGNGFTMTCSSDSVAIDRSYGFIVLTNGNLDNVDVVVPNFSHAILFDSNKKEGGNPSNTDSSNRTRYYNIRSAVVMNGESRITNSMISGGRAAVYAANGNAVITNSTIKGGAAANIHVETSANVILNDITLIQKPFKATVNDTSKTLMGLSVVTICDTEGKGGGITLKGKLRQYAWARESYKSYVPSDGQSLVKDVLAERAFTHDITFDDGVTATAVNLGVAFIPEDLTGKAGTESLSDERSDSEKKAVPYEKVNISKAWIYTYENENGTHDDLKTEPEYKATKQCAVLPNILFNDGNANRVFTTKYDAGTGWTSTLKVDLDAGNYSFSFENLLAQKYGKNLNYTVTTSDGVNVDKSTAILLNDTGSKVYKLQITDNLIYDKGGALTAEKETSTHTFVIESTKTSISGPVWKTKPTPSASIVKNIKKSSLSSEWSLAIPVLKNAVITYWSKTQGTYVDLELDALTPTTNGKQANGANAWTVSNDDYTLTITTSVFKTNYDGMPVVYEENSTKTLYYTVNSSNGCLGSGTTSRSITVTYTFKDSMGNTLANNTVNWSINKSDMPQSTINYDTFVKGGGSSSGGSSGDNCLAEGTLITMADGSKKAVEDMRKGDSVMVFDHLTGKVVSSDVIIVVKIQSDYYKNTFVFDDGTELVTINEHGIYDLELRKYVNIDHMNYREYIGHHFVAIDANGKISTKELVAVETVRESGYKYDIVTDGTLNYVAEDTLSVTHVLVDVINSFEFDDNMRYDKKQMQKDIEKYGLYTYDEWAEYCDISCFEQYNIPVMKVGISKGLYTKEYIIGLINTYVLDESVQIID